MTLHTRQSYNHFLKKQSHDQPSWTKMAYSLKRGHKIFHEVIIFLLWLLNVITTLMYYVFIIYFKVSDWT